MRRSTHDFPFATRLVCAFVTEVAPKARFTSFQILCNCKALPHRDAQNWRDEPNLLIALTSYRGGQVWVECPGGEHRLLVRGVAHWGRLIDLQRGPAYLNHSQLHATLPWKGRRVLVVCNCIRNPEKLGEAQDYLESVGFRPPRIAVPLDSHGDQAQESFEPLPAAAPLARFELRDKFELPPSGEPLRPFSPPLVRVSGSLRVEPRVLCYNIAHSGDEDLLRTEVQREIFFLLSEGAFKGFSAGPVCSSFSAAIVPSWRTSEFPGGAPWLKPTQRSKVQSGNAMLEFVVNLIRIAEESDLLYLVENPLNSWFWKQKAWDHWKGNPAKWDFLVDYCVFGTAWKKPTRFRSNTQLQGKRLRCSRDHKHLVLRGWDPELKISLTKRAEPYPRRLCVLLSQVIAQDAGFVRGCRKLDIVRCAKCSGARFGEASNPGPARRRAEPRANVILAEVPLVQPATAALQRSVWDEFRRWVDEGSGNEGSAYAIAVPEMLVELLCAYGQVLYSRGKPLQHYRQLLALSQRKVPLVRPFIRQAWEMLTRWERLEPTKHRPPLPEPVLEAMCSLAIAWRWDRWAASTFLGFYGCCRIGEILNASRADLFTPEDLLRDDRRIALQLNEPKTRTRGARVQHTTVQFSHNLCYFICKTFRCLPRRSKLYFGSPAVHRRRWDALLAALGIPQTFRLTPGSLRGGGSSCCVPIWSGDF